MMKRALTLLVLIPLCAGFLACSENLAVQDGADTDSDGTPEADEGVIPDPDATAVCGEDANGNGVGDTCEVVIDACGETDANGNGIGDACEVDNCGTDTDGDGVGQDCETLLCGEDADGSGTGDACEGLDCGDDSNGNGLGDACESAICGEDTNGNGMGDICEGLLCGEDADGDGVGDRCEDEEEEDSGEEPVISSFRVSPSENVFAGESVSVRYALSKADYAYLNGELIDGTSGVWTDTPEDDTTYLLWAANDEGITQDEIDIDVAGFEKLQSRASYRVIAAHPTDASVVYAGSEDGLLKSVNGGESFEAVAAFDGMPVYGIAFSPDDSERLFVGVPDGVRVVDSEGDDIEERLTASFYDDNSTASDTTEFTRIALSADGNTVYAACEHTLFYSNNSGAGWAYYEKFLGKSVHDVLVAQDGTAYAAVQDGLYAGGGSSFERVALNGVSVTALHESGSRIYVGTAAGELGKYENGAYVTLDDDTFSNNAIRAIHDLADQGLLFVAAQDGLYVQRNDNAFLKIDEADNAALLSGIAVAPETGAEMISGRAGRSDARTGLSPATISTKTATGTTTSLYVIGDGYGLARLSWTKEAASWGVGVRVFEGKRIAPGALDSLTGVQP